MWYKGVKIAVIKITVGKSPSPWPGCVKFINGYISEAPIHPSTIERLQSSHCRDWCSNIIQFIHERPPLLLIFAVVLLHRFYAPLTSNHRSMATPLICHRLAWYTIKTYYPVQAALAGNPNKILPIKFNSDGGKGQLTIREIRRRSGRRHMNGRGTQKHLADWLCQARNGNHSEQLWLIQSCKC